MWLLWKPAPDSLLTASMTGTVQRDALQLSGGCWEPRWLWSPESRPDINKQDGIKKQRFTLLHFPRRASISIPAAAVVCVKHSAGSNLYTGEESASGLPPPPPPPLIPTHTDCCENVSDPIRAAPRCAV